jgi:hypothetical protein
MRTIEDGIMRTMICRKNVKNQKKKRRMRKMGLPESGEESIILTCYVARSRKMNMSDIPYFWALRANRGQEISGVPVSNVNPWFPCGCLAVQRSHTATFIANFVANMSMPICRSPQTQMRTVSKSFREADTSPTHGQMHTTPGTCANSPPPSNSTRKYAPSAAPIIWD